MDFTVMKHNSNIVLDKYDDKQISDIVRFVKTGVNYSNGRTCYHILKYPIIYNNNIRYCSVKIKGAGFYSNDKEVVKPGLSDFVRREPHYGFDKNGNAVQVFSDIAPFGGMTESKATNEYNNFEYLSEKGISTLIPYKLLKYNDLTYRNESLAVVVALCTEQHPIRLYKLLWPAEKNSEEESSYYASILEREGIVGNIKLFNIRIMLIKKIAEKYALEVRKFSESGLYIHSGGWSNIQYNSQTKKVVLVDLDSSRHISDECSKFHRLYSIRDLISNIYRLLISLYNPNIILQYDETVLKNNNYVYYLLRGYFPEVNEEELQKTSNDIMNYYIINCFNKIKAIEFKMNVMTQEESQKYELVMFEFYHFCLGKIQKITIK